MVKVIQKSVVMSIAITFYKWYNRSTLIKDIYQQPTSPHHCLLPPPQVERHGFFFHGIPYFRIVLTRVRLKYQEKKFRRMEQLSFSV